MSELLLLTQVMDRLGLDLHQTRRLIDSGELSPIKLQPRFGVRVHRFCPRQVQQIKQRLENGLE